MVAEVTGSQWGMVTSAQATARGVSHMNLTRLAESGDLVRLSHGVYRDAGAPSAQHEDLRAAWLATDPARLASERLGDRQGSVVVSGESASRLHRIGDLRAVRSEFTTPTRRQSQRPDVHYRTRVLPEQDVTVRDGLPVTTRERTIADLVEDRQDLSIVGSVLRDAARQSRVDEERLIELLGPLAERNGHRKADGRALLDELRRTAGIDPESLAKQVAAIPGLGALVTARYLDSLPKIDFTPLTAAFDAVVRAVAETYPSDVLRKQLETMSVAIGRMTTPMPDLSAFSAAIASSGITDVAARIADQLSVVDWSEFARTTQPQDVKEVEP